MRFDATNAVVYGTTEETGRARNRLCLPRVVAIRAVGTDLTSPRVAAEKSQSTVCLLKSVGGTIGAVRTRHRVDTPVFGGVDRALEALRAIDRVLRAAAVAICAVDAW